MCGESQTKSSRKSSRAEIAKSESISNFEDYLHIQEMNEDDPRIKQVCHESTSIYHRVFIEFSYFFFSSC